ncbi:MAG: nucleoside triphosphate pyrophosphohydrolase [Patescibacteria group bacterium]
MPYKEYNKLVRDRIPEKIISGGETPHTRILTVEEYSEMLKDKLLEEAGEVKGAQDQGGVGEELADCLEVLQAIATNYGIVWEDIEKKRTDKKEKRGGFEMRVFLTGVDEKE